MSPVDISLWEAVYPFHPWSLWTDETPKIMNQRHQWKKSSISVEQRLTDPGGVKSDLLPCVSIQWKQQHWDTDLWDLVFNVTLMSKHSTLLFGALHKRLYHPVIQFQYFIECSWTPWSVFPFGTIDNNYECMIFFFCLYTNQLNLDC